MSSDPDQFERREHARINRQMEAFEKDTYDTFRDLGCSKGEAMKAANRLGQTSHEAKQMFYEKHYNETGVDLSKSE